MALVVGVLVFVMLCWCFVQEMRLDELEDWRKKIDDE